MPFELPVLPYSFSALEPHIDARTMEIHHDKHHATYVTNLNKALEAHSDLQSKTIVDLLVNIQTVPEAVRTAVRNNGGGHHNHTLFWNWLKPGGKDKPAGGLLKELESVFGSFDSFVEKFSQAGSTRFGSGWAWLVLDQSKKLMVYSTANQDSPLMEGFTPVLGLDVWEHAYYLNYQNRRADYIKAFWNVVNWDVVDQYYTSGK